MWIVDETLLAHVMHDLARGVIHTILLIKFCFLALPTALERIKIFLVIIRADGVELLVSFTEQFWINRHFFFKRFIFLHREVVTVEDIQYTIARIALLCLILIREQFVRDQDICLHPIIIIHGI